MSAYRGGCERELPGHDVRTVSEMGWSGIKNGPLLHRAAQEFDIFLTVDQGIEHQQNPVWAGSCHYCNGRHVE
jgi:hypothetical protein